MPLINCKVYLELNWIEDCILSSARNSATLGIADAKLHVPIVTLSTKGSAKTVQILQNNYTKHLKGLFIGVDMKQNL